MEAMTSFVDAYRDDHGVEPICRVLEIVPSNYRNKIRRRNNPETAPPRVQRDEMLSREIGGPRHRALHSGAADEERGSPGGDPWQTYADDD